MWTHARLGFILWSLTMYVLKMRFFPTICLFYLILLLLTPLQIGLCLFDIIVPFVLILPNSFILFDNLMSYSSELPTSNDLLLYFDFACKSALDVVAPLTLRQCKSKTRFWLTDFTREIRKQCGRCERQRKKDRLHFCLETLKSSWKSYPKAVKADKLACLSQLISANSHNPRVLYNTKNSFDDHLNRVVNSSFYHLRCLSKVKPFLS